MPLAGSTPDVVPIYEADRLLSLAIRGAVDHFLNGRYRACVEALLDARAFGGTHPDWPPCEAFLAAAVFQMSVRDVARMRGRLDLPLGLDR